MTQSLNEAASYDASPTLTLPSDGDDGSIESLFAAFQKLLNRTAALRVSQVPVHFSASGALGTTFFGSTASAFVTVTGVVIVVPNCQVGDVIDIRASATVQTSSTTACEMILAVTEAGGSAQTKTDSHVQINVVANAVTLSPACSHTVATAGSVTIALQANANGSGVSVLVPTTISARLYRT